MRDVSLLFFNPSLQADLAISGMARCLRPYHFWQGSKNLISHPAEPADEFESLACALVEITERARPASRVNVVNMAAGLCNHETTANVLAGFPVSQVENDLVDIHFSGEGLKSHIFLGKFRTAAESRAGPRPKDSSVCRLASRFIKRAPKDNCVGRSDVGFRRSSILYKREKPRLCSPATALLHSKPAIWGASR